MASTAAASHAMLPGNLSCAPCSSSRSVSGATLNAILDFPRPLRLASGLSPLPSSPSSQLLSLRHNCRRPSVSAARVEPPSTLPASAASAKCNARQLPLTAAAAAAAVGLLLLPSLPAAYAVDAPPVPPSTSLPETVAAEKSQQQQQQQGLQGFFGLTAPDVVNAPSSAEAEAQAEAEEGEWRYSRFLTEVDAGKVASVEFSTTGKSLIATTKGGDEHRVMIPTFQGVSTDLADTLARKGVETGVDAGLDPKVALALEIVFDTVLPLLIAFGLPFLLFNQANPFGPNGPFGSFLSGKGKFQEEPETTVRFDDVAGVDQAKLELQEMVDFLRNPSKYTDLGAKIPKGCLLAGPPGSGKTLLARAVAGEAGVPFFSIAASEFVEIFVGLGASRVRELFEKAKSKAPCIIFIDELDAVGRQRGGGMGGGNDEREQTINQLLTEMDGFQGNTGVIVLAATNRPDVLDAALTRPGRFDRQVVVDRPDVKGRVKILEVHSRGKRLDASVDLEKVARRTPGFTGADLQNLMNEAAILAARKDRPAITSDELSDALERITIGPERRAAVVSLEKQRLVAYHEAGHALVASLLSAFDDPVEKVTIVPRGPAGGLTFFAPSEERLESGLYSRAYLEAQLAVALGGRVAEEIIFGQEMVTTGASNDLQQVTSIARRMVEQWGFSSAVGQLALVSGRANNFLGGRGGAGSEAECSQQTKLMVDGEVRRLVNTAYRKAKSALEENIGLLHRVVEVLLEKESINGEELQALILESKASIYT
ncbi:hypothetical protein CLOM_g22103 [Closterium sp. NIES-68]|nr:hypothetical protein CLOM_g22103 [Closterium sp. NIES-68]GJP74446.1 hypothetical protein CLOP_g5026 [Closterium sp. NIES-67]